MTEKQRGVAAVNYQFCLRAASNLANADQWGGAIHELEKALDLARQINGGSDWSPRKGGLAKPLVGDPFGNRPHDEQVPPEDPYGEDQ